MISKTLLAIALCALIQVSFQAVIDDLTLPAIVVETFGSREMRYHHFLWHNVRETWLGLDASTQHAITKLGWAPPRPAAFTRSNGEQVVLEENDSGEDFLYMHRQMIIQVNKLVAGTTFGKVQAWKRFPVPGDKKWPVPPAYDTGDADFNTLIATVKTDDYYWEVIQPMEEELNDPEYLKTLTLGQLGAKLEFGLHKTMHLRFSELTADGMRPMPANPTPEVDTKWDSLSYRWLGDTYSSHVNPVFWRIHGWVDNMIENWRKANNIETIEWKGTWISGPWVVLEDLYEAGAVVDADNDVQSAPVDALHEAAMILLEKNGDTYFKNTRLPENYRP